MDYNSDMKVSIARMTIEELHRLPEDGNRYELIDGEVYVSAAPRRKHQRISAELFGLLQPFTKQHGLGEAYHAAFDVFLEPGKQTCVQPDILFVARGRLAIVQEDGVHGSPDLVIEITSESTYRTDLTTKGELYRRSGVKEYWIVDPYAQNVLVYRFTESADPRKLGAGDVLTTPLLPGLEIPAAALFAE